MFKSVRTDRSSQIIVEQIKDAIFQKKIRPGDKLPSERQLMEQFQACRVTVREALKLLEYAGILEIKRGTQGGAYVRDPNIKFINNFLRDMFSMGNINVADLTEARIAVEPFTLRLAAERMSEESLEQLRQNIDETRECLKRKNPNDARLLNLEFHRIIAQASGNLVIFFMIDSIMDIMENNISPAFDLSIKAVERTLHLHEEIYQTIKNRSPEKAQELMLKHVREIEGALETKKELRVSESGRGKPKKH
jgi:GntR family transcriptional regulator, transcriptional repressor for pyruvate dehydrogenase complex